MKPLDTSALTGERTGPYCSFNPVSRVQIWQWCSAMGDRNPLYLDDDYRRRLNGEQAIAPPAMMQMWTMPDINGTHAPGTVQSPNERVFQVLETYGFPGIVAVSYDITFHRLLVEGDRAHHYSTIASISPLKQTALGEGYFVTEHAEFLDQDATSFADALITYFVYRPKSADANPAQAQQEAPPPPTTDSQWTTDFSDVLFDSLTQGQTLPELAIPITHKLIVGGAIATQDFMPVHHNAPAAKASGMPDIFMNILTTNGLCARYLSDWAGAGSCLKRINFKLMAPNVPGDTMVMQASVVKLERGDRDPMVTVDFAGKNGRGFHVTGSATLALAG
jgi:acyl dehydratase